MLKTGILNPHLLGLVARIRHTNALVISDRGFPFWPQIETVDISLTDGVPTVLQVLAALRESVPLDFEPHGAVFKKRIPAAIGLIRTGDCTSYANMILISA
jgi:D-ribose pyranase